MKVHEKAPHVEIKSSSNPMDSLQGHLLPEAWIVPSWASTKDSMLAPYLVVLHAHLHVQNPLNLSLNM